MAVDKTERKSTPPPRLIDLAKLAAMLAPKGIRSKDVLDVYQKMYEDQIVSYPRTEDKYITEEQFNEMLPLVDDIADVVGIDKTLLTHRASRRTHIKAGCAHGANRPGPVVPKSLNELKSYGSCAPQIYEILAKNFLAMFGEDYEYDAQTGHVVQYPKFIGHATIPLKLGWKQIFQTEDEQEDEENKVGKGLGKTAKPFVYEGFPKKPPTPTTKWLMAQLEKHDVGTGATRTSIYADVTNENTKYPLLIETKGKLSMSKYGEESYVLLAGTHIGNVAVTEQLMSDMRDVADGKKTASSVLHDVQQLIVDDRKTMLNNKKNLQASAFQKPGSVAIGKCPKCGKDIVEGTKGFGCVGWKDADNPCKFTIWKTNGLLEPSKKKITTEMAQELLTTGECSVKGLVSKNGSKFNGKFKLKEDGSLDFEFAEREAIGTCPRCGRDIIEGKMGFGCVGYRDEANPCKFTIWKNNALLEKSKKSVTTAMAKKLLSDGYCDVKGLVSKNGNKYDAKLILQDDGERVNLNVEFPEREINVVGVCPRCGRDVIEGSKGFGCVGYKDEAKPCKFTIWKTNALLEKSGKEVTESMVRDLLTDGKCKVKGLKSSSGSTYNAEFKLADDGERVSLEMQLDEFEATVVGTCPRCGRDVVEGGKGFGCVGYKDESDKCSFFLSKSPPILASSNKELTETQAKKLLNGDTITIKGLKSKAGKKYDANFTLEDDGKYANLKMSFDNTEKPKSSRGTTRRTTRRSSK